MDHHLQAGDLQQVGIDHVVRRHLDIDATVLGRPLAGDDYLFEKGLPLLEQLALDQGVGTVAEAPEDREQDQGDHQKDAGQVLSDKVRTLWCFDSYIDRFRVHGFFQSQDNGNG